MANARRTYSQADELALATQVDGRCPLCGEALFYVKKSRSFKAYDLAHIYPLNPTPEEIAELEGVRRLHSDVNHPDNLIPLCDSCHGRFDKPRTRDEYEQLAALKQQFIDRLEQQALYAEYPIEQDIRRILDRLHTLDPALLDTVQLEFEPKRLDDKFNESMPHPTRQKIRHAVTDYYQHIKISFRELERDAPASSDLIFTQVKAFYLKQKTLGLSQSAVFQNVVDWIREHTDVKTIEAAEAVASFFVQNCEVFE